MNIHLKISGAFGDVLNTTPVTRGLRRKYPEAVIWVDTHHPQAYEKNPDVNFAGSPPPKDHFDLTIDLNDWYRTHPKVNSVEAFLEKAGLENDSDKTVFFKFDPSPPAGTEVGDRTVCIHPNVSWRNRTLSREFWGGVGKELQRRGYSALGLGTGRDMDLSEYGVEDTRNKLSTAGQAAVIHNSAAFVSCHSGLTALAGATETPLVILFTIDRPEKDSPWRRGSQSWNTTFIRAPVPCFGCRETLPPATHIGCKLNTYDCISSFDSELVAELVHRAVINDERRKRRP